MHKKLLLLFSICVLVYFGSWLFVYKVGINSLAIQSEDTLPAMFLPVSIIKHKTIYADDYYEMIIKKYPHPDDKDYSKGLTPFYFKKVGSHYVSAFPLISGLLALPIYYFPIAFGVPITWENLIYLSHLSASIIVVVSGIYLFLLLRESYKLNEKKAFLVTFIYLFCSINFALISNALWQHGALQLFIILFLYANAKSKYFFAGLFMGLAVLSRPTAVLYLPFLSLLLPYKDKKVLLNYILGGLITILFFAWYTKTYYIGIENNGYSSQLGVGWLSRFPEGFLGLWLSPSKGILVYSPIFFFSLVGFWQTVKNNGYKIKENFKYIIFFTIILLHTLVLGKWKHWYGGWGFGYRMASDIIPFLVLLIVPFIQSKYFQKYKKLFLVFLIFSFCVQLFGVVFFDGIWHAAYDLGFVNTSWLWSIKDSEFVFNIRRILVKLGYLYKACPTCLS